MGEESHSPDFRPIPLPGGDGVDGYGYVEGHQSLWGGYGSTVVGDG